MCLTPDNQIRDKVQQRQIKAVKSDSDSSGSDEGYLYSTSRDKSKIPTVNVKVNDVEIEMIVDTGASTDILDEDTFSQVNRNNVIALQPTAKGIWLADQLEAMGQFNSTIAFHDQKQNVLFLRETTVLFSATVQLKL